MEIKLAHSLTKKDIEHCDFSFPISAEIAKPYTHLSSDQTIATTTVEPTNKSYGFDEEDFKGIDGKERRLWILAHCDNIHGYLLVSRGWNNLVIVDDIALDKSVRGQGHGMRLVQKALDWSTELGLCGVKAETQSNNVAACHLYKKMGFKFGGYDEFMYYGIPKNRKEVALFWYYIDQ